MSERIHEGIQIADLNFQGLPGVIGTFVLNTGSELGLVETGPTTTLPALLKAIEPYGGLEKLSAVTVTHVHLDHSGAVGQLLRRAPHVRCYVHTSGAQHLIDPARLLRSAGRIYGDQMESLWGEVLPAPEDQIVAVDDADIIRIGGRDLEVVHTPGHASHHIALFDQDAGVAFTGDVAGVRLEGWRHVRPPTPPPDLDPKLWRQSVERLRTLDAETLLMTHYGSHSENIPAQLDAVMRRLDVWIETVHTTLEEGRDRSAAIEELRYEADQDLISEGGDPTTVHQYELATPTGMSVDGIMRCLDKPPAK